MAKQKKKLQPKWRTTDKTKRGQTNG
jgi:hypothetical protein